MHEIKDNNIQNMVHIIREKQVLLDSDLAKLYGTTTKRINEAVKNNPLKFPDRFCFVINNKEKGELWSKFSTARISNMSRVNPRVFTEQGVYMLATILRTTIAVQTAIKIMDTFVEMRKITNQNKDIFKRIIKIENDTSYIKSTLLEHENKIHKYISW